MKVFFCLALLTLLVIPSRGEDTLRGGDAAHTEMLLEKSQDLSRIGQYREALEIYRGLLSRDGALDVVGRAYVLSEIADIENATGAFTQSDRHAREALGLLAAAGEANSVVYSVAEAALADALHGEAHYREELIVAEQAVSVGRRTLVPNAPRMAILLTVLARACQDGGHEGRAIALLKEAAAIFRECGEDQRIELGNAYTNLAAAYAGGGKPKKALENVELALRAWEGVLPSDHLFRLYAWNAEFASYVALKQFRKAESLIPAMFAISAAKLAANHPDCITLLGNAAIVYIHEKKYDEAGVLLKQAVELTEKTLPRGHPTSQRILMTYAEVLQKLGRAEEAARFRAESQIILAFSNAGSH